jgi:sulfur carrier protein ThiS
MRIKVVAPFAVTGLGKDGSLELPEGARVRDVLKRSKSISRYLAVLPMMVNGRQVKASHVLQDDDVLVIVYPISGG